MKGLRLALIGFALVSLVGCAAPREFDSRYGRYVTPNQGIIIVDVPQEQRPKETDSIRQKENQIETARYITEILVLAGGITIEVLRLIR